MAKRAFDLVVSFIVVAIALPFWILIALAIKLTSRGPVFYRGSRIGREGRPFRIFKFRTMRANRPAHGPGLTRRDDPRITRVGRFLRKMKIDEMPQLLNVLGGQMSIVGPRPEDPRYVELYTPEERRVLSARPGMASPAFIAYRHEEDLLMEAGDDVEATYLEQILHRKLAMDLDYVDRRSFLFDLRVLLSAAVSLFTGPKPLPEDSTPASPEERPPVSANEAARS